MSIVISLHSSTVGSNLMTFEFGWYLAVRWSHVSYIFISAYFILHSEIPQDFVVSCKKCCVKCKLLPLWHDIMCCANCWGSQADFGCVKGCMSSDKYRGDGSTIFHFKEVKVISSSRGRPQLSRCLDYHVASLWLCGFQKAAAWSLSFTVTFALRHWMPYSGRHMKLITVFSLPHHLLSKSPFLLLIRP